MRIGLVNRWSTDRSSRARVAAAGASRREELIRAFLSPFEFPVSLFLFFFSFSFRPPFPCSAAVSRRRFHRLVSLRFTLKRSFLFSLLFPFFLFLPPPRFSRSCFDLAENSGRQRGGSGEGKNSATRFYFSVANGATIHRCRILDIPRAPKHSIFPPNTRHPVKASTATVRRAPLNEVLHLPVSIFRRSLNSTIEYHRAIFKATSSDGFARSRIVFHVRHPS